MSIYEVLNNLNIKYVEVEHKLVMTSKEAEFIKTLIDGIGVKNLFLKDKDNYFLVMLLDSKQADLKKLAQDINSKRLHMASAEDLQCILNLKPGSVTPLGIMNDSENKVKVIIDKDLKNQLLLLHPLTNTKTISISYDDLIKFIEHFKHSYQLVNL